MTLEPKRTKKLELAGLTRQLLSWKYGVAFTGTDGELLASVNPKAADARNMAKTLLNKD